VKQIYNLGDMEVTIWLGDYIEIYIIVIVNDSRNSYIYISYESIKL
jgi:hypothetical protein